MLSNSIGAYSAKSRLGKHHKKANFFNKQVSGREDGGKTSRLKES